MYKCVVFTILLFASIRSVASNKYHPLFTENKGQITDQYHVHRSDIDFVLRDNGLNVFIGDGQLHYQFTRALDSNITDRKKIVQVETYRLDVTLLNADVSARYVVEEKEAAFERYYTNGLNGVIANSYKKLIYRNIYPNIDWQLSIKSGKLKQEFILHPGANINNIKLKYSGATSLLLEPDGSLSAKTPLGDITESAPYSFTQDGMQIQTPYVLEGNILSYKGASYSGTLTIDPDVIWGTYYGGTVGQFSRDIEVGNDGYVYICGTTASMSNIATVGSHQQFTGGSYDAFLSKFDTAGMLVWGTYYGGWADDDAYSITEGDNDDLYLAGDTYSDTGIATPGAFQTTIGQTPPVWGDYFFDGFIARFNHNGERIWGTYYGGGKDDHIYSIAYSPVGGLFVGGVTRSDTIIATIGAHQPLLYDTIDNFVARFDLSGSRIWSTYYGSEAEEYFGTVSADNTGNVYFAGCTTGTDSISSPGSHQETLGGIFDGYLVKFNLQGQRQWATFYGGTLNETIKMGGCKDGNVYVIGETTSNNNIATPGSHQPLHAGVDGDPNIFVVKFNSSGQRLWGTYYGPNSTLEVSETTSEMSFNDSGDIYFTAGTMGDTGIATPCGYMEIRPDMYVSTLDVFLVKMSSNGVRKWGTYYGGGLSDLYTSCATDNFGHIYLTGSTWSTDSIATPGAYQMYPNSTIDAFLTKFSDCSIPTQSEPITGDWTVCENDTVSYITSSECGQTSSFTWTVPNGWTILTSTDTLKAVASFGLGTISVTANSICGSAPAQTHPVNVFAIPVPIITQTGNQLTTGNYTSYQWNDNGVAIPGATGQTYIVPQQGGIYTVTVEGVNGCLGTSAVLPVSVKTIATSESTITLVPNPNNGSFVISGDLKSSDEDVTVTITDVVGKVIYSRKVPAKKNYLQMEVVLDANTPKGMYVVKLNAGTQMSIMQLLIQ